MARASSCSRTSDARRGAPDPKYSLAAVVPALRTVLPGVDVGFCTTTDDAAAVAATEALADGAVLLMENTRFLAGEEKNEDALSQRLAKLGDMYVNDAFGSAHRAHASTAGITQHLRPAVAGLLMESELAYLGGALDDPKRPFVAILGGSKISGKIDVVEALLPKVDALLIGGAMACTFYKAMGFETGTSLVEPDRVEMAKDLIDRAGSLLILPHDATVAKGMDQPATAHAVKRDGIPRRRGDARHRTGLGAELCARDPVGQDRVVERPDGRVREATIRCRHAGCRHGNGGCHGQGRHHDRRRVATRPQPWSKPGWAKA